MQEMGANDSNFTLRRDAALMVRRKGVENTVFASIVEPHGNYSPVSEIAVNSNSNIAKLRVVYDESDYTAVSIEDMEGRTSIFILSNMDASASRQHQLEIDDRAYQWTGPYRYIDTN